MAGLNALIQKIERLAAGEVKQRIASKVADACHAQCVLGFQQQRDPYGVPWKARKGKGTWPLLDKTGAGINSLTARANGDRIVMRIKGYFRFHQSGTHHNARSNIKTKRSTPDYDMPARKIFPDMNKGLGTWSQPIQDAALSAVRELMR